MLLSMLLLSARYTRHLMVLGLIVGLGLPSFTSYVSPYIPELVIFLLFLTCLRLSPISVFAGEGFCLRTLRVIIILQILVPLSLIGIFHLLDYDGALALPIILMASVSSTAAAIPMTLMTDNDASMPLRLLILGTAFLPLTLWPILHFVPELQDAELLIMLRLTLVILLSAISAQLVRWLFMPDPDDRTLLAIDGATTLVLTIIVVGLLSTLSYMLREDLFLVLVTLSAAFGINYGFQLGTFTYLKFFGTLPDRAGISIVSGNRNIALYLTALPAASAEPLLLFIGCYQLPIYLTPILLKRLYRLPKS